MLWLGQFRYLSHKEDRSGGIFFDQQNKRAVSHEKDKADKEWPALSTKRCTSFPQNIYVFFRKHVHLFLLSLRRGFAFLYSQADFLDTG